MQQGSLAVTEIGLDISGPVLQDSQTYDPFQRTLSFDVRSNHVAEGANISGRLSWKVLQSAVEGKSLTISKRFISIQSFGLDL